MIVHIFVLIKITLSRLFALFSDVDSSLSLTKFQIIELRYKLIQIKVVEIEITTL